MNKVFLIGRMTKDPELHRTASGVAVSNFSIAVDREYVDNDGKRQTDFFTVTAWRAQAENCVKYLKKGSKIAVAGTIQNREFTDKDNVKRTVSEIQAQQVEFLTPKSEDTVTLTKVREPLEEITDNVLPF